MSESFSADWAGFEKAKAKANRLNKAVVFDALSTAAITHVSLGFDGEGDQRQIERATAYANEKPVEFPPVTLTLWIAHFGCTEVSSCELSMQEAVEHLCYGFLEEGHDGWEVNDGSFGEFTLHVSTRTITLDFCGRLVHTDYKNHNV